VLAPQLGANLGATKGKAHVARVALNVL